MQLPFWRLVWDSVDIIFAKEQILIEHLRCIKPSVHIQVSTLKRSLASGYQGIASVIAIQHRPTCTCTCNFLLVTISKSVPQAPDPIMEHHGRPTKTTSSVAGPQAALPLSLAGLTCFESWLWAVFAWPGLACPQESFPMCSTLAGAHDDGSYHKLLQINMNDPMKAQTESSTTNQRSQDK